MSKYFENVESGKKTCSESWVFGIGVIRVLAL
jgi:hypothetical protein